MRIVDQSYEGIVGILLSHKSTDLHIAIFCCYLPPENSPWGSGDMGFFGHLLGQIVLVRDDVNGKTGNLQEYLHDTDSISERTYLDEIRNNQGLSFIDFLMESNMCTANGRITP